MARDEEKSTQQTYYIPWNYDEAGGVFGGKIKTRNAVECVVLCGPLAYLEYHLLHFSTEINIIIAILTIIPVAFLSLFGLGGETLSQILFAFIRYRKHRRKLSYRSFSDSISSAKKKRTIVGLLDEIESNGIKSVLKPKQLQPDAESNEKKKSQEAAHRVKAQPLKQTREKRHEQNQSSNKIFNSAMRERLIQMLELDDEDDE